MRPAQPNDLDQIGALLTARGDAADAEDHALVMADPNGWWESCAVVTDGAQVVSTLALLDEELRVAVPGTDAVLALPAGQVELVATDPQYEGRGRGPRGALRQPPPREIRRYYVRLPAVPQLFDVLRPVLDARLAAFDGDVPDEIVLSFFGSHLRLPVNGRQIGRPVPAGTMQAPNSAGGAGIAPDALPELLSGPDGIAGLRRPDVYPGPHQELMAALFPRQTADVLTFYR